MTKKILSLLLALCIVVGMLPATALAATVKTIPLTPATPENPVEWEQFVEDFSSAKQGDVITIEVTGKVFIPAPLVNTNGATFYIRGIGSNASIAPDITNKEEFVNTHLFTFTAEPDPSSSFSSNSELHIQNLTLDGGNTTGLLAVTRYGKVRLGYENTEVFDPETTSVTFCKGSSGTANGGGVCLLDTPDVRVWGCVFKENKGQENAPVTGGLYYSAGGALAKDSVGLSVKGCTFRDNTAHSGGAMYVFGQGAYAYIDPTTKFINNHATQRGGAIHCHGSVTVDNATFEKNSSDGQGGTFYVSASNPINETTKKQDNYYGVLVLSGRPFSDTGKPGLTVTGSHAGTVGGAAYVAKDATIILMGELHIKDNTVGKDERDSNIYTVGTEAHIVATARFVECAHEGEVGISTSSPTIGQNIILSPVNLTTEYKTICRNKYGDDSEETMGLIYPNYALTLRHLHGDSASDCFTTEAANYSMANAPADKYDKIPGLFSYDGGLLGFEHNTDKDHLGKLKLNYEVPGDGPSVIFDYNVPGMEATIYPSSGLADKLAVGDKIESPRVPDKEINGVDFIFLGWSTQPSEGTRFPGGTEVEVKDGQQVYYAQWDVVPPPPDPVPVVPSDLFTVYFDYNYNGGGVTSALVGTFKIEVEVSYYDHSSGEGGSLTTRGTVKQTKTATIPFVAPSPSRPGYTFKGWSTNSNATSGSTAPSAPTSTTTYYATWKAKQYTLTWNANEGTGSTTTTQDHDATVIPPTTPPTRKGHEFTGWYLDKNCTVPLASGTLVTGSATFYAGWTPLEYTITWDANYTGGGITSIKQYYGEKLYDMPGPTREGYGFLSWNTERDGTGKSGKPSSYGNVEHDETFYAQWSRDVKTYTVEIDWQDQSNNDRVRPESITVQLMANGIPAKVNNEDVVYTFYASKHSGDTWTHPFNGLPVADAVSNEIVYTVAITSPVSDEYSYGIENKSAGTGYILMTHSLILRDVDAYVVWDDDSNNDGIRPPAIDLQLCVDDTPVAGSEKSVTLSGSGNTWFYRFRDVQKYNTPPESEAAVEIPYNIAVNEPSGYTVEYNNYTAILHHDKDLVSRTVHVEWQDNNDQDGKRPVSMAVQLYADNVPLEGKVVLLSDANNWTYTWDELPKFADGGRQVTYSARVTSTLVDYTARSAGMTIEMTYVPSSTSISAFVTWTDENDADGLRPDYITAELVADGKPTGDRQVLSATNGWTMTWSNYPIYKDGKRIEYTFKVDAPEGYEAAYHGVYDTSGLSAVLTHARLKQPLTGNIVWEDRDNQSGGRMSRVAVQLYADGAVIDEDEKVWISADEGWEHTFSNLPIYRDGGEEIKYSMVLVSDPGKYVPTTSKMTITMRLEPEYVDVPFQIIWDDNNNSDGQRPGYVAVTLLVDGKPSQYGQTATAQTDWAADFTHLDRYGANGLYSYKAQLVIVPEGYTATYTSADVVVLKRVAETKNVTATVIWQDNDDQYGQRPEQVTLTLYADQLDGNGPQNTGRVEKCKAADGWEFTFEDVPAYHGGKNIIYSVVASGNLPNYTISYDGMDVYMTHDGYIPTPVTIDYTANVVWHDGHNAKGSRPYNVLVTLYANGEEWDSHTLTEGDLDNTGYTWSYTFKKLPAKMSGKDVVYTIGIAEPAHYTAKTQGNTIILTHVMDIPILVRWHDQRDNDGFRPESLTLELFGDSVKTDTAISLTGIHNAETWRNSFRQIPVWSDAQMDREIVYTWAFAGNSLAGSDYTVEYNEFTVASVGSEDLYPIDISRPGEIMDVSVFLKWNDDNDRDGLRLASDTEVILYADGKAMDGILKLTGSNEAESWTGTFEGLPVWKDGKRIVYSIDVADKNGYTPTFKISTPFNVTMTHEPAKAEVKADVVWDKTVKDKFDIAAELLVDGEPKYGIGVLDADNGYCNSWGEQYVYHDHGTRHNYTVRVAEQTKIPDGHTAEPQRLTITVRRVKFQLTGQVLNYQGKPVPTALITMVSKDGVEQTVTDSEGKYSFTVASGDFTLYAHVVVDQIPCAASATINNLNDDTNQNLTLSGWVDLCKCTFKVWLKDGVLAPGATVDMARVGQGQLATFTLEDGTYTIDLPCSSYQLQACYTDEQGICYLSEQTSQGIWGTAQTINIYLPTADKGTKEISGTVLDFHGNPVANVVVQCYRRGAGGFFGAQAETNEKGEFTLRGLSDDTYELVLKDQAGKDIPLSSKVYFAIPDAVSKGLNIILPDDSNQTPTPSGYGTLTGVVTDKSGQPMDKAQVVVTDKTTGATASVLTTDPNGVFETQLPAGEYTVEILELFDNTTDLPIRVDDDAASREDGPITADSFTISGEVLDEDGQPKEGVTVYLYVEDDQAIEVVLLQLDEDEVEPDAEPELGELALGGYVRLDEVVTAEDGKYVFTNLPAGRYVVKVAEGIGGNGGSTDIPVTVAPFPEIPDDADLTITTDSYTVTGIVDGNAGVPVSGATVKLLDEAGKEVARLTTGKDGTYQFEALPEGDYTVNISYPDSRILASGNVTISDDSFATFPGQFVTGTAKDSKGNVLPNMTVTLTNEAKHTYTAVTDKDGGYRIVVPDGKYTVEINVNGKTASKAITVNGQPVSADLTVTISTGTTPGSTTTPGGNTTPSGSGSSGIGGGGFDPSPVEEQPTSYVLSGVVLDKDKKPVEGATVTAVNTKTGETHTATTGPDGKYALAVPKGSYSITITYGSTTTNPKKVSVSKDTALDNLTLDNAGRLVRAYVNGYADGTFGGDNHISRSEVAALISRVSADFDKDKTYSFEFEDVAEGVWYANNLGYCVEAGLIQGRGNGHFDPTASITRSEFAAIVARFLGLPNEVTGENPYTDTAGNWAEGYIAQLTAKGIVEGKGDGKFDPTANITRYEAVTMLNRALERTPDTAVLDALAANRTIRVFPDLAVTHWAYYQVLEAANDHYHK